MAAAELEAGKNSWQVAITIIDSGGNLVMFHKFDNTQLASIGASEGKARTALTFKRPSKALDDAIAAGGAGLRLLAVKDITPLEGGLPIIIDGKIIGAIGVSGALLPRTRRSPRPESTRSQSDRAEMHSQPMKVCVEQVEASSLARRYNHALARQFRGSGVSRSSGRVKNFGMCSAVD